MTPQQMLGVGLRIFALWLGVTAVRYLALLPILKGMPLDNPSVETWVVAALYLAAAVLLWIFPLWTAHLLLPRTRFENHVRLQPAEAARVGCALMGLWFFAQGLLNVVWFFFQALLMGGSRSFFDGLALEAKADLFSSGVGLLLGIVLVARSDRFAQWAIKSTSPQADA